jgi:hypothetical protein
MAAKTGELETRVLGQDSWDRTARTGKPGQDSQVRTAGIGLQGEAARQESRGNTARTGQRGQDSKNRTARKRQLRQGIRYGITYTFMTGQSGVDT